MIGASRWTLNATVAALTTAVSAAVDEIKTKTQNILDALKAQTPTGDLDAVEAALPNG